MAFSLTNKVPGSAQFAADLETDIDGAIANVAAIATADATTLTTAIALANANKAKVNSLISALTTSGIMAAS